MYKNYLLYQIANALVKTYPWIHVSCDSIFHPEQYDKILKNLPKIDSMVDIRTVKFHPTEYPAERLILPETQYDSFWTEIQSQFLDGDLKHILLHKFKDHLIARLGEHIKTVEFYDTFQLTLDTPGYVLGPHTDRFAKIFSLVINLASDTSHTDQGTAVYTSKNPADLVYKTDYAPNTGFGIFRSEDSWHGVETTTVDRWSIQYIILGRDRDH